MIAYGDSLDTLIIEFVPLTLPLCVEVVVPLVSLSFVDYN